MKMSQNKEFLSQKREKSSPLPDRVPGVGYTLKHRNCVEALIRHYCGEATGKRDGKGELFTEEDYKIMLRRAKTHDVDKLMTYLCYPQFIADYFHRLFSGHHAESVIAPEEKSKYDWMEMVLDMESSRYTKFDKTYTAYEFIQKVVPQLLPYTEPYLALFELNRPQVPCIEEIKESVNRPYYEDDLIDAIRGYMDTTHIHELDAVSRRQKELMLYPGGSEFERPSRYVLENPRYLDIENFRGTVRAAVFDMDSIAALSEEERKDANAAALEKLEEQYRRWAREHKAHL